MKSKLKVKYSPDADAMVITVRSGKPDYGDEKAPGVICRLSSCGLHRIAIRFSHFRLSCK